MKKRKKRGTSILTIVAVLVLAVAGLKILIKANKEQTIASVGGKTVSMPYINPEWTEYMKLTEEEKAKVQNIPDIYVYNYIPDDKLCNEGLPSKFNLRDEYATTLYNQGSESLCWAYATATMIESNLKVTKGIDTNISVKQLDYLTASESYYKNNYNPYTFRRPLHGGLAYVTDTGYENSILSSGVVPVLESKFNVEGSSDINLSDIANKNNVDYTIAETVNFPIYENTEEYKNMLKSFIKNYGAVYVGTVSPNSACANGNVIDWQADDMFSWESLAKAGHAMTIVGWDDNYDVDNDGTADGVWILQNSWNELDYVEYYISYRSTIQRLYWVKQIVEKNWDNNYDMAALPSVRYQGVALHQANRTLGTYDNMNSDFYETNMLLNRDAVSGTLYVTYNKPALKKESLDMINFVSASQNSSYKVYISKDGNENNYEYIKDINTDMPGLYTVNFENIMLDGDKFSIKIESPDGAVYTQVNAFTSDISGKTPEKNISSHATDGGFNLKDNYQYNILSYVQNIPNGSLIEYKLHDESGTELQNEYIKTVTVNDGKAIGNVEFPRRTKLNTKVYMDIIYNGNIEETIEIIYNPNVYLGGMQGEGTEENPYVITNATQLSLISNSPSAHYILGNDIDLTYNENNNVTYNRGMGWTPLNTFCGVLDGNGYAIKNMFIYTSAKSRRR